MVTLKDIAKEAGVSVMTVSNIVNGNYTKVSKETAEHVQKIISQMGYVPNASARSLAKSKTNIIAIIMRGEENENPMLNPYYSAMVGAMIRKIQQHGYYAMVNIMKSHQDILQSLRTWNVDGAIFLGLFDDEIEAMYSVCNVPMVFVDSYSNVRQLSNIGIDDFKGGQLAANYFISRGHRSVAFIGPTMKYNGVIRHRFDGFNSVLRVNGMEVSPEHIFEIESDVRQDAIVALGKHIAPMRKEFSAIFITSDQIASYVVQGLVSGGVSVPEEMSVIGFDNLEICRQISPQLTTIAQDLNQKAHFAVSTLFQRLADPSLPAQSMVLDVKLVVRDSVASL